MCTRKHIFFTFSKSLRLFQTKICQNLTLGQISFNLQTEQITRIFFLQLGWIGGVELDTEEQQRIDQRQAQLPGNGLLQVQPVLEAKISS